MKILVCFGRTVHGQWDIKYPNNFLNDPIIQAWQRYQAKNPQHEIIGYDNVSELPKAQIDVIIQYENHKHVYNPHIIKNSHHFSNAYKVFCVQDTVRYPDTHIHLAKHFDMIFSNQRNAEAVLKPYHNNIVFYPMGIDPYKIFKIDKFPKQYDIGLVSGMKDFVYRSSYLKYVEDIAIGMFWTGINPNYLGFFYNSCKIGLNLSTRGTYNMIAYRTLEVMGSGSLLITNRLNKGILEELYTEDVHYVAFDDGNYDEFRDKVKYYLYNTEEREKIAQEGCKLVHEKYTWDIQVEKIVEVIEFNVKGK